MYHICCRSKLDNSQQHLLKYDSKYSGNHISQEQIQDDERIATIVLYNNCNPRSFVIDIVLIQSLPLEQVFKSITPKDYFAMDNRDRFLRQHITQGNIVVYSIVVEPNNVYKVKIKLPTEAKLLKCFVLADLQATRSIKKAIFDATTDIIIYCDKDGLYVKDNLGSHISDI